ncbi:protein DpdG [Pseudomonas sp. GD03817]|uniref:protein DpdG n=1 Tax=unclassified Pseudomonas TaxID=196821 RepID=UPI000F76787E|nr:MULTISPECIES: protein DpdG [unclassified Pseudomonas]MDH1775819.1 protein DpdG [Pseudomonas sp. GD03817]
MSMVNNANPGSSLVLLNLIDRALVRRDKPLSRIDLLEIFRPDSLPKSENARGKFNPNLDFWLKEGLWLQDDGGNISVSEDATDRNLAHRVLKVIISNARESTDQALLDGNRIEPFFRAMTCLLVQQGYTFMGGDEVGIGNGQEAVNRWLPGARGLNVTNELSIFLKYGDFLGFLEPYREGYIVDPTRAIKPFLESLFAVEKKLPIRVFIGRLAEQIPLLDNGRIRCLLEPLMQELGWHPRKEHHVSPALSHALVRLESTFRLRFEKASDDASSMELQLPGGVTRVVSDVIYVPVVTA